MKPALAIAILAFCCCRTSAAAAQTSDDIELIAATGTPLRVAVDETMALTRVGQPVRGTLVEPLYAYDRMVLPKGARVTGHVSSLDNPSKLMRLRAWSSADFSPKRHATIEFDAASRDGDTIALGARAQQEAKRRARESIASAKARAADALSTIKGPGKMERIKFLLLNQLPYHRQYLSRGTVYDARLQAPVTFGAVHEAAVAPAATLPAPSSVLRARLATTLDSSSTTRGTKVEAIVIQPVFSNDGELILPQGTRLTGEVTVARPARRFHRNGQLRFLFESLETPKHDTVPLLASLHSIDVSADDHIALDEEGGAAVPDSKTRFIAPSLAVLALVGASDNGEHTLDADDEGFVPGATIVRGGSHVGSRSLGGFFGLGLIGTALARLSTPVGIAFAAVGVARTTYSNILGKGLEVRFVEDTPIELQLAPGPSPAP
jgi:hypothetical protein